VDLAPAGSALSLGRAFPDMVQTEIPLVSHPFRREHGMDVARKSIAKKEMLQDEEPGGYSDPQKTQPSKGRNRRIFSS